MKILVNTAGHIIASANDFSFGAWEDQDTVHGMVVRKWKAWDKSGNVIGYYIDENPRAIIGAETPCFSVFTVMALPEDFVTGKYLYLDGEFTLNPDWTTPELSLQDRVTALETQNKMLISCILELSEAVYA